MEDALRFLNTYKIWVYAGLALAILVAARGVLLAWHESRTAVFGLEKESAQRRLTAAGSLFGFLILLMTAEFMLVSIVYPDIPNTMALATPTLELELSPQAAATLPPQAALGETPEGIPTIEVSNEQDGCIPGQIEWLSPMDPVTEQIITGDTLRGEVILRGTVNIPNLGFYKYEYNTVGTDIWTPIAVGTNNVIEGPMGGDGSGVWNTAQEDPGDYRLRLVVTDNVNNVYPACIISIRIAAP